MGGEDYCMEQQNNNQLLHQLNEFASTSLFSGMFIVFLIVSILLGIGTGYVFSKNTTTSQSSTAFSSGGQSVIKGTVEGSDDLKTFNNTAEGVLTEGGIDGEGQFHLVRPGGESQNVYLTSATVDLAKYLKRKIKVNGQTQKAQTAGWLMDVGRVEVLE